MLSIQTKEDIVGPLSPAGVSMSDTLRRYVDATNSGVYENRGLSSHHTQTIFCPEQFVDPCELKRLAYSAYLPTLSLSQLLELVRPAMELEATDFMNALSKALGSRLSTMKLSDIEDLYQSSDNLFDEAWKWVILPHLSVDLLFDLSFAKSWIADWQIEWEEEFFRSHVFGKIICMDSDLMTILQTVFRKYTPSEAYFLEAFRRGSGPAMWFLRDHCPHKWHPDNYWITLFYAGAAGVIVSNAPKSTVQLTERYMQRDIVRVVRSRLEDPHFDQIRDGVMSTRTKRWMQEIEHGAVP